jgi:hypothetical protein
VYKKQKTCRLLSRRGRQLQIPIADYEIRGETVVKTLAHPAKTDVCADVGRQQNSPYFPDTSGCTDWWQHDGHNIRADVKLA